VVVVVVVALNFGVFWGEGRRVVVIVSGNCFIVCFCSSCATSSLGGKDARIKKRLKKWKDNK
jgi:hypothetical protein